MLSNHDCLPMEGLRIQELFCPWVWVSLLESWSHGLQWQCRNGLASESESTQVTRTSFLPPCLLARLPQSTAQIKDGSAHVRRCRLKVGLPSSNNLIKKNNLSQVYPGTRALINSRCSRVNQEQSPHVYPLSIWGTIISPVVTLNFQAKTITRP